VLAALSCSAGANAFSLALFHDYREFVDRGMVTAQLSGGVPLECPDAVAVARSGNRITLSVRVAPPEQTTFCPTVTVNLGVMAAGSYEITGRMLSRDGATLESDTHRVDVLPIEGRCNADPALTPSIFANPKDGSVARFIERVNADAAFAASLGNPVVRPAGFASDVAFVYPPLDDIPLAMDRLKQSGLFSTIWRNSHVCFSPSPPDVVATFVEYFNVGLDHYFYTGDAGEIAAIDAGRVGPGWSRTGKSFRAVTVPGCPNAGGQTVVYRFHGIPGVGPNSHFFTRDRAECSLVDKSAKWNLEGVPMVASAPNADGTCDVLSSVPQNEQRVPLYRAWRPFGDSNHRFTTERAVVAEMVVKGWVDEGPVMCVLPPA